MTWWHKLWVEWSWNHGLSLTAILAAGFHQQPAARDVAFGISISKNRRGFCQTSQVYVASGFGTLICFAAGATLSHGLQGMNGKEESSVIIWRSWPGFWWIRFDLLWIDSWYLFVSSPKSYARGKEKSNKTVTGNWWSTFVQLSIRYPKFNWGIWWVPRPPDGKLRVSCMRKRSWEWMED